MRALVAAVAVPIAFAACSKDTTREGSGAAERTATGTVVIEWPNGTKQALTIDACFSGQMLSFYGYDAFNTNDLTERLRVVADPVTGTHVVLYGIVPTQEYFEVRHETCTAWDVTLQLANSYVNDIRAITGEVKLDCIVGDGGGHLVATIKLDACSYDRRAY